jgi:hypothetical protein
MAAKTGTYTLINAGAISGTVTEMVFTSIPATYTDLLVVVEPTAGSLADTAIQFNSDTGSNYSRTYLTGNGTAASSGRNSGDTRIRLNYFGGTGGSAGIQIINIMDYANATTFKTVLNRCSNANYGTDANVGLWRNTTAITTVRVYCDGGGNWTAGNIKLYGIEAAK